MLEEFIRYPVEWEEDGNRNHVNGTLLHLAQIHAWIGRTVTTVDTEAGRAGQRQTLLSKLYGRYLRRASAGILKGMWKGVNYVHTAKLDNGSMGDEEERERCW